jgi:hypothetical protein
MRMAEEGKKKKTKSGTEDNDHLIVFLPQRKSFSFKKRKG